MKNTYLFPNSYRRIGQILAIPSVLLCGYYLFFADGDLLPCRMFSVLSFELFSSVEWFTMVETDAMRQISFVLFTISLLFIAFSREKEEDEYMEYLRSHSMRWAMLISGIVTIVVTLLVYNLAYLYFVFINLYLILILFILKYRIDLHRLRKTGND
ncbi:hypothetical protein [Tannerella forsythia]|uniref:Uncharacterized protein n=1 Tax=Tannerella forsythia TaxID=28112 RepID=A0A3P1XYM6_TANFO|nr:hypothetical protein [Tannerella forsythia]RRD63047.1 hypothetical protein EII40_00780 [Tannerella forsythia]